jgi:glucose dehydrogenase
MRSTVSIGALLAVLFTASGGARQQATPTSGNWPMYRHDLAGTGFSPLAQITPANVAKLTQAWTYSLQGDTDPAAAPAGRGGAAAAVNSQATPIVIDGVMYLPAANRIVALDAGTGKEMWQSPVSGGAPSRRGVAYWPGESGTSPRIFFMVGRRLIALDARNGAVASAFGKNGEVDIGVPYNSVPGVFRNVIVVGANTPPGTIGGIGNARAFDARTGVVLWEFSSVAQPGSVGHDTWEGESWKGRLVLLC